MHMKSKNLVGGFNPSVDQANWKPFRMGCTKKQLGTWSSCCSLSYLLNFYIMMYWNVDFMNMNRDHVVGVFT